MPFLTTEDGVQLHYRDWGKGPAVILVHGWPLNGDMWERQATYLAEQGCRVIDYDRRGFGRSGQPWDGYDYGTLADDLRAVIEAREIWDATLVGFSMGGGEVVRYLSRHGSSRVSKAVLISAVTPYLLKTDENPEGLDSSTFEEIEENLRKDRPAFLEEFGKRFYGRTIVSHSVSQAVLDWTQNMALTGSLRATLAAAKAWSSTDFREDLKKMTIPVRIIHGTGDETVPIEVSARRSVSMIPNASLTEYEGEPHGLVITSADRLNQELLAFVGMPIGLAQQPVLSSK